MIVTVGGVALPATWEDAPPNNGPGLRHGSVNFGSNTGAVVVTVGSLTVAGKEIAVSCPNGIINWNAWVGSAELANTNTVQPLIP